MRRPSPRSRWCAAATCAGPSCIICAAAAASRRASPSARATPSRRQRPRRRRVTQHRCRENREWPQRRRARCSTRSGTATSSSAFPTAPASSTSTATWCTRSPARRRSRACGWPAARCAGRTRPSRWSTTTSPPRDRSAGIEEPESRHAGRDAGAQRRRVRRALFPGPRRRARASCTSSGRNRASACPA